MPTRFWTVSLEGCSLTSLGRFDIRQFYPDTLSDNAYELWLSGPQVFQALNVTLSKELGSGLAWYPENDVERWQPVENVLDSLYIV